MNQKERILSRALFVPKSLRLQLLSRSLLILAGLLVLVGLMQYVFMKEVIYRNKADSLQSQIMSISPDVFSQLSSGSENSTMALPRIFIPDTSLAFIDVEGNYSIWSNGRDNVEPPRLEVQEYQKLLNNPPNKQDQFGQKPDKPDKPGKPGPYYKIINNEGIEELVVLQPIISNPNHELLGVVQISTHINPLKELLIRQLLTFLFLSIIALLVGLLGFLPILKKTLVPLFNMVDTAEQIDAGNLDRRFPTMQGQVEIDRLADSFNGMLERLEGSFDTERETKEQMRRFIADASHELRTPLTSIHGFLEVLLRGAANQPEQLDKALKSMHSESQRLNKLVHDLLLLSKLDRTPYIELKEGALDTVIREMEPQLHILAGNRKLSLHIEKDLKCKYDTDQMKQVVLNLFHNAVHYTDSEQGHIQIALNKKDNGVQLYIQDNGQGINDMHLPHVFDRFYRSDSSRTRKYGGAGLGLSITKSIIDAHGGTISVVSHEGEGCTFYMWLPDYNLYI
jgi:two-component system OmpR family sensor kinase